MGSYLSVLLWPEPEPEEDDVDEDEPASPQTSDALSLVPLQRYAGRALPLNVHDAAAELVAQMAQAVLTLDESDPALLQVYLPSKRKQAVVYTWPLLRDPREMADAIRALMTEDAITAIRSAPELCARYPGLLHLGAPLLLSKDLNVREC